MSPTVPSELLRLAHGGRHHAIVAGGRFAIDAAAHAYRDIPSGEMAGILRDVAAGKAWREAVGERYAVANPWLHRIVTDPRRARFFDEHPPAPGSRVLDIGSGWGQVALPLARTCQVCALEPTPERLEFIAAAARQENLAARMWFVQSNLGDIQFLDRFDCVTCIGVLEWVPKSAPDLAPREAQLRFLADIRHALAPGGRLVIGIENRLGLKYLLGAPDDHLDSPGIAVLDAELAASRWRARTGQPLASLTHTRAEYQALLHEAGFGSIRLWSAFPDYKLPEAIVPAGPETDAFLATHFVPEHDGIRGQPLPFQAELGSHYRSLAALGVSSDFAPSYYLAAEVR